MRTSGTLVLTVAAGKQLQAGTLYVFQIVLTNPSTPQESPAVTISVSGTQSVAVPPTTMEKGSGDKAPLFIKAPGFVVARIGQEHPGLSSLNKITITIQPNFALAADARFTVEGLLNSGTADSASLEVRNCNGFFKSPTNVLNQGRWSQSSGSLEMHAARQIEQDTILVCSFNLVNPSAQQAAAKASISVNSFTFGQVTNLIRQTVMRNAPSTSAPFMISASTFTTANIGQSSPYPGVRDNIITVTLKSNVALASVGAVVSSITISGLIGSATSSTSALPLTGSSFQDIVGQTGAWDRDQGSLRLTVANAKSLVANKPYVFSFRLDNPLSAQEAPPVSVSANGGQLIAPVSMIADAETCTNKKGDRSPLFIYSPGFLTKEIGTSITAAGTRTLISVTLQTSVSLASISGTQTNIRIDGLRGFTNADSSSLPIMSSQDVFGKTATWRKDSGSITLGIKQNAMLAAGDPKVVVQFELLNGPTTSSLEPTIATEGFGSSVSPTPMNLASWQSKPTIRHSAGVTIINFTAFHPISKDDTIILVIPGATLDKVEGKNMFGVVSFPNIFSTESSEEDRDDALAAGRDVASAEFRPGFAGKASATSSLEDGGRGTTIQLDTSDTRVYDVDNVYAGMSMRIEGSRLLHSIVSQTKASAGSPGVAQFYPKFSLDPQYKGFNHVPEYSGYEILSQIELVAKSNVCSGTIVTISFPSSLGLTIPVQGLDGATISHVIAGRAKSMAVGTLASAGSPDAVYSGISGRPVQAALQRPPAMDLTGYQLVPTEIPPPSFVFVDGFRTILSHSSASNQVTLSTGYGSVKRTRLCLGNGSDLLPACEGSLKGLVLRQKKSISADVRMSESAYVWLSVEPDSLTSVSPALVTGSVIQLSSELLRFTGDWASEIISVATPAIMTCEKEGETCSGTLSQCVAIRFSGCTENPSASLVFNDTGDVESVSVEFPGVCLGDETPLYTLQFSGVTCQQVPECWNTGCHGSNLDDARSVLKMQRRQFSSSAASLECSADNVCHHVARPSMVYLEEGGLAALQYTESDNELDEANQQLLRLNYQETVTAVVGGDHVSRISLPQIVGSRCRLESSGSSCRSTDDCASITFTGCEINPRASLTFRNGEVSGISIDNSLLQEYGSGLPPWAENQAGRTQAYGNSLCKKGSTLVGTITLAPGVNCDVVPSCGGGCKPILDSQKDVVIIKRTDAQPADFSPTENGDAPDVARVHAEQSNIKYKVVLVPDMPLSAETTLFHQGSMLGEAVDGMTYTWVDATTGEVMVKLTVEGAGVKNVRVTYGTDAFGQVITYPDRCRQSCNITNNQSMYIGSRLLSITFDIAADSSARLLASIPTIYNNMGIAPARRRTLLEAPANYAFRINGDCKCPANVVEQETTCHIARGGLYQAVLVPISRCTAVQLNTSTPQQQPVGGSSVDVGAIVGGVIGGVFGLLLLLFVCWYLQQKKVPSPAPPPASKQAEATPQLVEEGPVFVGRPMPVTPDMMAQAYSPGLGPVMAGGQAANWSYATSTPQAVQASPVNYPAISGYNGYSPTLVPLTAPLSPGYAMEPATLHQALVQQPVPYHAQVPVSPIVISTPVPLTTRTRSSPMLEADRMPDRDDDHQQVHHQSKPERVPYGV